MLKVFGPDKLEAMWTKQLPAQVGAFKEQGPARREQMQGYEIVLITCSFEKTMLDARVVFDKAGKIAGLGFVPPAPPVKYEPPAYADPAKFEETEVTVGSGEWALPGTLTMPKGAGPFPGLVLVHGSGPNDRDETLGPNKPFKDLAWGLATRGIAVLRYDKRGKVHGKKILADPKLEAAMTVKDETIDDALAAAALLQKAKGVDPKRVFILGHSLGGFLMPRIALAAEPLRIAGFISMAGLTRPLDDTIVRQMTYLYGLAGNTLSDDDKKKLEDIKARGGEGQGPHRRRQGLDRQAHRGHADVLARRPRLRSARDGQDGPQAHAVPSGRARLPGPDGRPRELEEGPGLTVRRRVPPLPEAQPPVL